MGYEGIGNWNIKIDDEYERVNLRKTQITLEDRGMDL